MLTAAVILILILLVAAVGVAQAVLTPAYLKEGHEAKPRGKKWDGNIRPV